MRIVKSIVSSWIGHKNTRSSAAIAFYTIFSITPLLAIGVGAVGLFISKANAQKVIVDQVARIASAEAAAIVKTILLNFKLQASGKIASVFFIIVMIYSASMVFDELRTALNKIFGVKRHENSKERFLVFIRGRIISGLFAFSAGALVIANIIVSTSLTILGKLTRFFPHIGTKASFHKIGFINQSVSFLIVSITFFCFFRFLPHTRPSTKNIVPGIITSVILFEAGKYLLKLYLTGTMVTSSFGAGGTFVAAIVWVYYSVQTILLGAEVSNYFENKDLHSLPKSKRKLIVRMRGKKTDLEKHSDKNESPDTIDSLS